MATTDKGSQRLSNRVKAVRSKVDHVKTYAIDEALKLVKETATAKFDESVDIAVNLGVDAKKSDQTVRGSVRGIACGHRGRTFAWQCSLRVTAWGQGRARRRRGHRRF